MHLVILYGATVLYRITYLHKVGEKMTREYGVVLIGCGHIGREHIQDIYYKKQIHIIGVVDVDPLRAQEFCTMFGADSWSTDYRDYLTRSDVDIVIVATYVNTHLSIVKDCLSNKKHVICEKPIGRTMQEGKEFADIVKQSDCKVLISHVLRHNKTYQKVAQLIQEGVIGDLTLMRMVQNHHCKDWERYKRLMLDCSPVVDCGVHYMDVMQWFAQSPIVKVDGFGSAIDSDLPEGQYNYGIIHVRLQNGCVGYYEVGWSKNLASSNLKEFIGLKGRISIILNANRYKDVEEGDLIELYLNETNEYRTINCKSEYKNMWGQMQKLIEMIETNAPAVPTIDEVFSAFRVVMCADSQIRKKEFANMQESELKME